ncbi:ATP-binding protein [Leifsonia sp. Leaf264]|uniref:ATP-binding protein n=1 Tax=Leifsonia sp. Leaf264 TaxID=1736314 RepID=UPI0006FADEAB|nr:ATP-binding protein [Leifsonia sp. Leaf264]KQO97672.1 hypothetical protein ASF30_14790 [Leifsonia sp. Leaf264]
MTTAEFLDITPDPKVLLALTQTPLKPLDALCELIDNGIDAFAAASMEGIPLSHRLVEVTVPGASVVKRGEGMVRVYDNGGGLDRIGLENTLRAGFSGKNRFDTLGLFGMGFNIATGKLGRRTRVTTARQSDQMALQVTLDLPTIVRSRSFNVPVEIVPKPTNFEHGTIVEVDGWWPDGDSNAGFAAQLGAIPKLLLRQQLGRRYATVLKRSNDDSIRVLVNQDALEPFEHCVWSESRFVERKGWGTIPAQITFNEVIATQRRCVMDGAAIPTDSNACLECQSEEFRTVDERIRGWVGIQRYDDNNKFGIDLIRKGRTIRVSEKDAFFNYQNEVGESVKEYPTDQQTGRIVGEVHLDHVPVDFQKQDFQRTTDEWIRAVAFLRGASLLPSSWSGDERNETPVSKLFQGYRKVRNPGKSDMYMGRWDESTNKPTRISRAIEAEYYQRFVNKEPGFFDDSKWWELVESAGIQPIVGLSECPHCGFQNLPSDEVCDGCDALLRSKPCVACGEAIQQSAVQCPHCGASQIPEVIEPWSCNVCGQTNDVESDKCVECDSIRGSESPISAAALQRDSSAADEYSFKNRVFTLTDGRKTEPLDIETFRAGVLRPAWNADPVPSITFRSPGRIKVFVNESHPLFAQLGTSPQQLVAIEAAQYLYSLRTDLQGRPGHTVPNIAAQILAEVWSDVLVRTPESTAESIRAIFERIPDRIVTDDAADFYDELDEFEQRQLADRLISLGRLDELTELKRTGAYLQFTGPSVLAKLFRHQPSSWFGSVWNDVLPDAADVGVAAAATAMEQKVGNYSRCLEDCAAYLRFIYPDPLIVARAQASKDYLEAHLL